MTAQLFPNVEQILTVLMSELPEGVYATDRADDTDISKRSYSSSELRAHAQFLADLYANLKIVNDDKAITTVTPDGLASWEKLLFREPQDTSASFAVRQSNLFAKFRSRGSIARPAIEAIISSVLTPLGLTFDVITFCDARGGWILDFSELDFDTFLHLLDPIVGARTDPPFSPLDCDLDFAAAGLTAQDLLDIQQTAYTYEVRIYGVADAATLARLDLLLTQFEPARSTHVFFNDATPFAEPLDVIDFGLFTQNIVIDEIDFGLFIKYPTVFDVWDFGGFV